MEQNVRKEGVNEWDDPHISLWFSEGRKRGSNGLLIGTGTHSYRVVALVQLDEVGDEEKSCCWILRPV